MKLRCGHEVLSLERMAMMGVLNVTPDSFSDGGRWLDAGAAIGHGLEMVAHGAQIIDVGGESTRPGAAPVAQDEELSRVIPVIRSLAERAGVPISIDTRKPLVAQAALDAGASIVNDTLGEEGDGSMELVAADAGAAVVIMHSRGTPQTMTALTTYDDVVTDVIEWLRRKSVSLLNAGVGADSIVLDPGLGFAKTPQQNLVVLNRLEEITALPHPVLVGSSRKSFIGKVLHTSEDERVEGTIATVLWALAKGARLARVHDVGAVQRAVAMAEAISGSGSP